MFLNRTMGFSTCPFFSGICLSINAVLELNGCFTLFFSSHCSTSKRHAPLLKCTPSVLMFSPQNKLLHTHIRSSCAPSTPPSFILSLLLYGRSAPAACPDLAGRRLSKASFLPSCSMPCVRWTRCYLTSQSLLNLALDSHLPLHPLRPVAAEKGPLGSALRPP